MGKTSIEWTRGPDGQEGMVWNPVTGCTKVSPGCAHCYAERIFSRPYPGRAFTDVKVHEDRLEMPRRWKRPRRIFVNSLSDLFHESIPEEFIDRVFDVIWDCPQHTFQVLTKRVERMVDYVQKRSSARSFGWTERERTPIKPGDIIHLDDIFYRNQCGYAHGDWECSHPGNNDDKECHNFACPIASSIDDRKTLMEIGVEADYEYDKKGLTEEGTDWMRFHSRPLHALPANLQLGFSAEDQESFEARMLGFQALRWIVGPHNVLFVSLEPMLGPINFNIKYEDSSDGATWWALGLHDFSDGSGPLKVPMLNWVIAGGESGPRARPSHPDWFRSVRDQCQAARVPFFFKQWGEWAPRSVAPYTTEQIAVGDETVLRGGKKKNGRLLDSREWNEFPKVNH